MSREMLWRRLGTAARRFGHDPRGGVAALVAITLPVLFGFAMLAVDAGRYFNLHTSVQWAADALALAGAAELDRKDDSIKLAFCLFRRAQRAQATFRREFAPAWPSCN